jgi:hypothetical protein
MIADSNHNGTSNHADDGDPNLQDPVDPGQEMWDSLEPAEKCEIILSSCPPEQWHEEEILNVLAVFYSNAVLWMRIKSRAKQIGVSGYDLERAVKQIRGRHATWKLTQNGSSHGQILGQDPAQVDWFAILLVNTRGEPHQNAFNIGTVLRHHQDWQGAFWWDAVRMRAMVHAEPLSDKIVTEIAIWLGAVIKMSISNLRLLERCILARCQDTPKDLLQEWILGLPPWDKTPRLKTWLAQCAGTETTDYGQHVSATLPVSMVARAMEPGVLYRHVVILEGPEELKKSTLVRALGGDEWTVELSIGLESKEAHMMLLGAWVAELPELDTVSRTEDSRLKAFFTMRRDSYIPKFSNHRVDYERRTIFVGTTNEAVYLKGQTGNSRFLPVKVTKLIDVDALLKDREQIFAEALAYYRAHPDDWWKMSVAAEAEAVERREERRVASIYEDDLRQWLDHPTDETMPGVRLAPRQEVTWAEIAEQFLRIDKEKWKDSNLQRQIAAALRGIGWEPDRVKTRRFWKRIR